MMMRNQKNDAVIRTMLPGKLKVEFTAAVRQQGNSASAMLRGFMRAYIEAADQMPDKPFNFRIQAIEVVKWTKSP